MLSLVRSLAAWAAQGSFVATGTTVQLRERDSRQSADIRRIVSERQQRLDQSYAGAIVAAFWNAFPNIASVDLHFLVTVCDEVRDVRVQPTYPTPTGDSVNVLTFDRFAAVVAIAKWWTAQDFYQAICADDDFSDVSVRLVRADVKHLLAAPEVHGLAVFRELEQRGRIVHAGCEPVYSLAAQAKEVGHA